MSLYEEDYMETVIEEKKKFKRFCVFLQEANHGIYNKDPRLKYLTKLVSDSIKNKLELMKNKFEPINDKIYDIELETLPPSKKEDLEIDVSWNIRYIEEEQKTKLFKKASASYRFYQAHIEVVLIKSGVNHPEFLQEVKDFVDEDLNIILYHEIKHVLDRIDKKLTKIAKKIPTEADILSGKYQSLDKEIYNFLLSIIGEIEGIKKREPTLSYSEVIKKSKVYDRYVPHMKTSKQNTLKGKLVDFWIDTYGKKSLH